MAFLLRFARLARAPPAQRASMLTQVATRSLPHQNVRHLANLRHVDVPSFPYFSRPFCSPSDASSDKASETEKHVSEEPPKPRMSIIYTCGKCDTRSTKSFTKDAYEKGVVVITCGNCEARHVIADNLGWFGEEKNVEEIMAKKGVSVARITDKDIDFS